MGYISLTVFTSFTFLVTYFLLISGAHGKLQNPSEGGLQNGAGNELMQKRPSPAVWLKSYPGRHQKPLSAYSVYRRGLEPEVEFVDEIVNDLDKRFDDYGHLRFGKRGGGEGEGFDDYGHMRFGK